MKHFNPYSLFYVLFLFVLTSCDGNAQIVDQDKAKELKEKTAFQTGSMWMPEIDIRSDVAIVYGVDGNPSDGKLKSTFEERLQSWRERGYNTHFMTGIAWGSYQDYFLGEWDGINHLGEGQVEQDQDTIWHGHYVPYIVPTKPFLEYMKQEIVKKVIDNGVSSIYLEEPEFWARAGYSSAFKKEWQNYYGFPWRPQHESPENTWLANKLKYELYYNALDEVSSYAKLYGKEKGMDIKIYVPTHSLVNYSSWQIVSPEASLASLDGIDGYIAQVWTGTARERTFFNGEARERTFENAYLEYGSMVSMTKPTGRKMFFLTDPIEDRGKSWEDYKKNYQATFVAKLLYPSVADFEVMPWPERIYTKPYRVGNTDEKILIPRDYSTQMQVMINALNDMPTSKNQVNGNNDIGVLMGNSLMFQRFPTHNSYDDPRFSNFYGQTLPLIKNGVPVQTVHMENLQYNATLENTSVLIVSYSNMKPNKPEEHEFLAKWVKNGGVLVYVGRDDDPYQTVMEWWNTNGNSYKAPSNHLFELLGVDSSTNYKKVGKGALHILRQNPKEFVLNAKSDNSYLEVVKTAYENDAKAGELIFKNNFYLERGPYIMTSVLDETNNKPEVLSGLFIDLFDPNLPVLERKTVEPNQQAFLYNLNAKNMKIKTKVIASASRISEETSTKSSYEFICKSPINTTNVMRVVLPKQPKPVEVNMANGAKVIVAEEGWDSKSNTYFLKFENSPEGIQVKFNW